LAAGDFNKDGKLDLAGGSGASIYIFLGNGNGTFKTGPVYTGINNQGYLAVTDLDGDGNLDLFFRRRGERHLWR
jgi:FG-GAP-like repeat